MAEVMNNGNSNTDGNNGNTYDTLSPAERLYLRQRESNRRYQQAHREKIREYQKEHYAKYYEEHPEKMEEIRKRKREAYHRKRYGSVQPQTETETTAASR
jgi:hypothetical protein